MAYFNEKRFDSIHFASQIFSEYVILFLIAIMSTIGVTMVPIAARRCPVTQACMFHPPWREKDGREGVGKKGPGSPEFSFISRASQKSTNNCLPLNAMTSVESKPYFIFLRNFKKLSFFHNSPSECFCCFSFLYRIW